MSVQEQITALAQAIGADIKQLQAQTSPAGFFRTEPIAATATGQTVFTVPGGYTPGAVIVSLNGATLPPADYTATNGTNIALASGSGIVAGSVLLVYVLSAFEVADALPIGGTAADATRFGGHLPSHYATQADLAGVSPGPEFYQRSNILGTVSQSGGVPTGAIIERGSNANGEYTKYADGTLICRKRTSVLSCTTAVGAIFVSANETWAFPASFVAPPEVVRGASRITSGTSSPWPMGGSSEPTTTGVNLAIAAAANNVTGSCDAVAIGRWY